MYNLCSTLSRLTFTVTLSLSEDLALGIRRQISPGLCDQPMVSWTEGAEAEPTSGRTDLPFAQRVAVRACPSKGTQVAPGPALHMALAHRLALDFS